jgi:hypothetical protein
MTTDELVGPDEDNCPMTIKITDLGLSRTIDDDNFSKTVVGTPLMSAP